MSGTEETGGNSVEELNLGAKVKGERPHRENVILINK